MSETRKSLRKFQDIQKRSPGRASRGGGVNIRQFSLSAGITSTFKRIQELLNEIGRFINSEGQMASFDFLGHRGTFLYHNRNFAETIASGVVDLRTNISASGIYTLEVDTESGAASDDLDTLNIHPQVPGNIVIIKIADSARTVTLTESGNMQLGGTFTLSTTDDRAMFHSDGENLYALALRTN